MLTDEAYSTLKRAYSTGFKMVVAVCPRCSWDRGFFFFKDGRLGFDPGCICTGRTGVKVSGRELMEKYLQHQPDAYQKWLDDAAAWNARLAEMEVEQQAFKQYLADLKKKQEDMKKSKLLF